MTQEVLDRRYHAYGGAAALFECGHLELLVESGAGTGKSFSVMQKANWGARKWAKMRILFLRKTRKSMNESILPDWEEKILWPGHPAFVGDAKKENRDFYEYPNKSRIVLGGLDNVERIMSAQYDWIFLFEATEATLDDWEKLLSRLRNSMGPYHQIVADCNPGPFHHWLNLRANAGKMSRVLYRHEDNPLLYDHAKKDWTPFGTKYINDILGSLTGHRRKRLLEHEWVSAEGQVWNEFDPTVHVIDAQVVQESGQWMLWTEGQDFPTGMSWFFASMDFGYRNPGCLQLWGVDSDERMYLIEEHYRVEKELDWWAEVSNTLYDKYKFVAGVADSAEPRSIDFLNDRIGPLLGRSSPGLWRKSDKSRGKIHGLNQVRGGLLPQKDGTPKIFFLQSALQGRDPTLSEKYQPCGVIEEIPSYVFMEAKLSGAITEQPDPASVNHGCDAMTYAAVWCWRRDYAGESKSSYKPWTFGDVLGHDDMEFDDAG